MTQEELHNLLEYKPATGEFFWKVKPAKQIQVGAKAGYTAKDGYTVIRIQGSLLYAHRLAVLYMTGEWPKDCVDHVNHIRSDNRWSNLSQASFAQNNKNTVLAKNNVSGVNGVAWVGRRQKWYAYITVNYVNKFLGYFDDLALAITARKEAEILYGFHPNHGKTCV